MSDKRDQRPSTVNEGIQADKVEADVIAVGRGAQAIKSVYMSADDRKEILGAIDQLRKLLDEVVQEAGSREVVKEDVAALENAVAEDNLDRDRAGGILQGITSKLRMVGVVVRDVAGLAEPIAKIAGLLRVPLALLGL